MRFMTGDLRCLSLGNFCILTLGICGFNPWEKYFKNIPGIFGLVPWQLFSKHPGDFRTHP